MYLSQIVAGKGFQLDLENMFLLSLRLSIAYFTEFVIRLFFPLPLGGVK